MAIVYPDPVRDHRLRPGRKMRMPCNHGDLLRTSRVLDHCHPRCFFSCTYEMQILQLLCFDIHARCWGGTRTTIFPSSASSSGAAMMALTRSRSPGTSSFTNPLVLMV